jgi:hypothetical protein
VKIVYLTVTVQFKQCIYTKPQTNNLPPIKPITVLSEDDACHWHFKTVEHIFWFVVSSSSQLTADRWFAVMLKANKTATVQDFCRRRKKRCDRHKGETCRYFGEHRMIKLLAIKAVQSMKAVQVMKAVQTRKAVQAMKAVQVIQDNRQCIPGYQGIQTLYTRPRMLQPVHFRFLKENINWWIYFLHFVQYLCSELESGLNDKELCKKL